MEHSVEKKDNIRYPKSVFFIISNEFCERFSYYGMRTVLALYLTNYLRYDADTSTVLYHAFTMLCYFFPLIGAIIADSYLGKFRTIFYLSIIYAVGNIVLSLGAIPVISIPHRAISLLGLFFIAFGTGGIKPCVSSFGGDQFVLPQQSLQLQQFFSFFYFSINSGSMISTFLTPVLRNDVKCFGENNCFSLAFGVPAILMIVSVAIFVAGKPLYRIKQPEENIIVTFTSCVYRALRNKIKGINSAEKRSHWLEYANDKFSKNQISDFQAVLNVAYLFIPMPLFWALFDQQGSRWTFQATNMDGRILGFTIKPDQMQVVNPVLILAFIPLFELFIYPALKTIGVKRPLQKLVIGGFLAALSFVLSAVVESKVQESYGVLSVSGEAQLRIFNDLDCGVTLNPSIENVSYIPPLSPLELLHIQSKGSKRFNTTFSIDSTCPYKLNNIESSLTVSEKKIVSYFVSQTQNSLAILRPTTFEDLNKNGDGEAKIRVFYGSSLDNVQFVTLQNADNPQKAPVFSQLMSSNSETDFVLISPGNYNLVSNSTIILSNIVINPGEVDMILLRQTSAVTTAKLINMVPPNKVHMLWQLPQLVMITAGEIMYSITGLEFSFTQSPPSMKSLLSAGWLLTCAFGNLIVVIISELKFFNSQVYEFLLFAGLMAVDMIFLILLSMKYSYVNYSDSREDSPELKHNSVDPNVSQMTSMSSLRDEVS